MSFVSESVSGTIRFKGTDSPDFTFSYSEVEIIKKVWEALDLANYSQSVASSSTVSTDAPVTTNSPATSPKKSETRRSSLLISPSKANNILKSSTSKSNSLNSSNPLTPISTSSSTILTPSTPSKNASPSKPTSPSKVKKAPVTPLKGTLKIYDFQVKLCSNILKFEDLAQEFHHSSHQLTYNNTNLLNIDSEIGTNQFHILRFKYQTDSMIQMITYVISNLNNLSGAAYMLILKLCHFNSRLWAIDNNHYHIVGESLVLTLIEILGRNKFPPEYEVTWINFYNKLLKLLLWHAEDAKFELGQPVKRYISSSYTTKSKKTTYRYAKQAKIHVPDFSAEDQDEVDKLFDMNSNVTLTPETSPGNSITIATCNSSAKSGASILSLQTQDDISSLSTLDQSPRKAAESEEKNRLNVNRIDSISTYTDDEDEDEYISSYATEKYPNGNSRIPRTVSNMSQISQPILEKEHESDDGEEEMKKESQKEYSDNTDDDSSFDLYNAFSTTPRVKKRSSVTRLSATLTKSRSDRDLHSRTISNSDQSSRRSSMNLPMGRRKSSGQLGALVNANGYSSNFNNESIAANSRLSKATPSNSLKSTSSAEKRTSRTDNCVII